MSAPGGDELSITINNAAGWMKQTGMASPTIPDKMGPGRSEDLVSGRGENGDVFCCLKVQLQHCLPASRLPLSALSGIFFRYHHSVNSEA